MCHGSPMGLMEYMQIVEAMGFRCITVPYDTWREELVAVCGADGGTDNALYPLLPMFAQDKASMGSRSTMPSFSCTNTTDALKRAGLRQNGKPWYKDYAIKIPAGSHASKKDGDLIDVYIGFFVKTGFLPPPQGVADGGLFGMDF